MSQEPRKSENIEEIRARQQQEMLKDLILRQGMTSEARERLGRVKSANPELASQAGTLCAQIIQQGKGVDDKTLKIILDRLTPKREIRITRR